MSGKETFRFYRDQPLVIAHRGARDVAPENTLAAFRAAIDLDADGIELDIVCCITGEIVVLHDDSADRTTDGSGLVREMPFSALRELDAGAWFSDAFVDERIPLLQEVLDLIGPRFRINIEIKSADIRGDGIEQKTAQMIRARDLGDQVIISSFNPMALWRTKRIAPDLKRGLLYAPDMPIFLARAWSRRLIQPDSLHPQASMVDEHYMRWARDNGYRVNVWTVNEIAEMHKMIALGVDAIITDHPGKLREILPR
jgi:glycerophosphoryl diester phosphodiesterase